MILFALSGENFDEPRPLVFYFQAVFEILITDFDDNFCREFEVFREAELFFKTVDTLIDVEVGGVNAL